MSDKALRKHLSELLEGKSAHVDIESVVVDFPTGEINTRVDSSPHTAWQLLEHMRIAQRDILEFCRSADYESPPWPEGYWPTDNGTDEKWKISVAHILADLDSVRELARNDSIDLFARIKHGDGQTVLREILLVADHNAYHLGQLMLVRRMLESK